MTFDYLSCFCWITELGVVHEPSSLEEEEEEEPAGAMVLGLTRFNDLVVHDNKKNISVGKWVWIRKRMCYFRNHFKPFYWASVWSIEAFLRSLLNESTICSFTNFKESDWWGCFKFFQMFSVGMHHVFNSTSFCCNLKQTLVHLQKAWIIYFIMLDSRASLPMIMQYFLGITRQIYHNSWKKWVK